MLRNRLSSSEGYVEKTLKRGQTHVAETGWIVSWRSLPDLVRTKRKTKKENKKNTWWFVVDTIPESVDETDDRPAGEALHFGMPLESHVRVREKVQTSLFRLTFHLPSYPR